MPINMNPKTKEIKTILGLRDAAKLIGGKCSKTGIRNAIKNKVCIMNISGV